MIKRFGSSPVGPLSPAVSQASSMLTAEEGQITWMEGDQPTQTDRQVYNCKGIDL